MRCATALVLALIVGFAHDAGAAVRIHPADPSYVVLRQGDGAVRGRLREREAAASANPNDPVVAAALIAEYLALGRSARDARYFGRAESVLNRWSSPSTRELEILRAEVAQYRHDFRGALATLDRVLRDAPQQQRARTLRASIALVVGEYALAGRDCAVVLLRARDAEEQAVGTACLAAAVGARGQFDRAERLIAAVADAPPIDLTSAARGYAWAVRGEIADRRGDRSTAVAHYARAIELNPLDNASRVSLAELLAARGDPQRAVAAAQVDRPGLGLLVSQAQYATGAARAALVLQARDLLELERQRGDAPHWREAALVAATIDNDPARALVLARENFARQRELLDVRLYARLASQMRSLEDQRALQAWLDASGVRDAALAPWLPSATQ
jgi:tetratricopeptide (TPR) repeat protein